MTYCVGMLLDRGLVFMSDTRTNAGLDNISTFRKMHVWEQEGDRVITLMSAGNLATTQAVVSLLEERTKAPDDRSPSPCSSPCRPPSRSPRTHPTRASPNPGRPSNSTAM